MLKIYTLRLLGAVIFAFMIACTNDAELKDSSSPSALFQKMAPEKTQITFVNEVYNTEDFNIFKYRNFYNGGGVAIGDINNDRLPDIYLTSNLGSNKLYINKGNFEFEDVTDAAGVGLNDKWSTGVVMVDLDNDGWLDIYVCNAGIRKESGQHNALFINNRNGTFTEKAKFFGLDDSGYTTHAAFFDFDADGDLDVYLLNNSFIPVSSLNNSNDRNRRASDWEVKDYLKGGGDKLLRNDRGDYNDVSEETGIIGNLIGFGLGVTVGDVNGDFWPDIYVSNDLYERDYLYINQQDGTFDEQLEERMQHISLSSRGADMSDINNDGHTDVFVTEMLPDEEFRLKTTTAFDNINNYQRKIERGLYHQFMQNTLQLNDGSGNFSEIAHYADVAASDWSWGALLFDMDNDRYSDIYVCNGIYHDVNNQDFIDFFANDLVQKMAISDKKEEVDSIINKMPSTPIRNKAFRNKRNFKFEDKSFDWGFDKKTFSNGASYGDLDNDGDLDLVINNVNQTAGIYKNKSREQENTHYIKIKLRGGGFNGSAIGATVVIWSDEMIQTKYLMPSRGFQSSVDYTLHFGLGKKAKKLDSLQIIWPDRRSDYFYRIPIDTLLNYRYEDTRNLRPAELKPNTYLSLDQQGDFEAHVEDDFVDFHSERNMVSALSHEGPATAVGDLNGDGLEDVFIGGASGQAGVVYFGKGNGFRKSEQGSFAKTSVSEDTEVVFFDADGDDDLDIFVGSGGNHFIPQAKEMQDRLYKNDGSGRFTLFPGAFANTRMNTSVAVPYDFDGDGDMDLFVGSRSFPGNSAIIPSSYLYRNDGEGRFENIAVGDNQQLGRLGKVSDAAWVNLNDDDKKELVVVGEWMSPKVFSIADGVAKELKSTLDNYIGWWHSLACDDIDADGDMDLYLGNIGENFYLDSEKNGPIKLWVNDFNQSGQLEGVLTRKVDGKDMPVLTKKELTDQFNVLRNKNSKHADFANRSIQELFDKDLLDKSLVSESNYFSSVVAFNEGDGNWKVSKLPAEIQWSCMNDMELIDVNSDNRNDLVLAGNNLNFLPQFGRLDASKGHLLLNMGGGQFFYMNTQRSGLNINGKCTDLAKIKLGDKNKLLALINNGVPQMYSLKK